MSRASRRRNRQAKRKAENKIGQIVEEKLLEQAPSSIPRKVVAQFSSEVTAQYSGPVPPPSLLAQYDEIIPGAADRIFAMAEKQLDHRIELERTVVRGGSRRSWWGLILGFCSTVVIATVGLVIALNGAPVSGATVITGTVVALAAVFVVGKFSQSHERTQKAALLSGRKAR